MALVHKKITKTKQIKLIGILVLVIGITFGVLYFGFFRKQAPPKKDDYEKKPSYIIPKAVPNKSSFELIKSLNDDPIFKKLESFGTWPLSIEPKGRSQPFIKIQTR